MRITRSVFSFYFVLKVAIMSQWVVIIFVVLPTLDDLAMSPIVHTSADCTLVDAHRFHEIPLRSEQAVHIVSTDCLRRRGTSLILHRQVRVPLHHRVGA